MPVRRDDSSTEMRSGSDFPVTASISRILLGLRHFFRSMPGGLACRRPARACRKGSVDRKRCRGQFLEVEVLGLFDGDADEQDLAALEFAGRLVVLADGITAVAADAETITRQSE